LPKFFGEVRQLSGKLSDLVGVADGLVHALAAFAGVSDSPIEASVVW
jgi:hypothetical protein